MQRWVEGGAITNPRHQNSIGNTRDNKPSQKAVGYMHTRAARGWNHLLRRRTSITPGDTDRPRLAVIRDGPPVLYCRAGMDCLHYPYYFGL